MAFVGSRFEVNGASNVITSSDSSTLVLSASNLYLTSSNLRMTGSLFVTGNMKIRGFTSDPVIDTVCSGAGNLPIRIRSAAGNVNEPSAQVGMDFGFSDSYRVTFAVAATGIGSPYENSSYFYSVGMSNGIRFITSVATQPIELWPGSAGRSLRALAGGHVAIGGASSINGGVTGSKLYVGSATAGAEAWLGIGDPNGYSWRIGRDNAASGDLRIRQVDSSETVTSDNVLRLYSSNGNISIGGLTAATAKFHLPSGTTVASSAPLKFTSGSNLATPENGAVEFDGSLYVTSGSTRKTVLTTLMTFANSTTDTLTYITGTKSSKGTSTRGTTVIAGDLVVSGSLFGSVGPFGTSTQLNLIGDKLTISTGTLSGIGATGGSDVIFYVSGTNGGKGTSGTSVFTGDLVVSGVTYFGSDVQVTGTLKPQAVALNVVTPTTNSIGTSPNTKGFITSSLSLGNIFRIVITDNTGTFNAPINAIDGQQATWIIKQDSTGTRLGQWSSGSGGFAWPGGVAPVLSTSASATDLVTAQYDGTASKWLATFAKGFV